MCLHLVTNVAAHNIKRLSFPGQWAPAVCILIKSCILFEIRPKQLLPWFSYSLQPSISVNILAKSSSNSNITTRAMKRSSSSLEESQELKAAPQPEISMSRLPFALPWGHYAMIYIDYKGHLQVQESKSIQDRGSSVFTPEVRQNFLEILDDAIYCDQPTSM